MGEAKRRGDFEKRKKEAIERDTGKRLLALELSRLGPSPKHTDAMKMLAAIYYGMACGAMRKDGWWYDDLDN